MRFLLLLLIVSMIVAGLAWYTGHAMRARLIPVPAGPGEIAWGAAAASRAVTAPGFAAPPILTAGSSSG